MWALAAGTLALGACGPEAGNGEGTVHEDARGGAAPPRVLTLETDEYVLKPGEEAYLCQSFGDPFDGGSRLARAFTSRLGLGGHHLLLFYGPHVTESGPLEECASFEFAPTAYGAQRAEESLEFPPGVAVNVPAGEGVRIQVHYFNSTEHAVAVRSSVRIVLAEPAEVESLAGTFFVQPEAILVRAHSRETITRECALPFDVNVVAALSHMHKFGVGFQAGLGGAALMNQGGGESATIAFSKPRFGASGSLASVSCTYENPESFDILGGDSFATEEMCILSAYYFPLPPGVPGTIDACNPGAAATAGMMR